jgi:hypothetical protein
MARGGAQGGLEGVASFVEAFFGTLRQTRPSREPKGTRREQNGCESAERSRLEPRRSQNAPMSLEGRDVQVACPFLGCVARTDGRQRGPWLQNERRGLAEYFRSGLRA